MYIYIMALLVKFNRCLEKITRTHQVHHQEHSLSNYLKLTTKVLFLNGKQVVSPASGTVTGLDETDSPSATYKKYKKILQKFQMT